MPVDEAPLLSPSTSKASTLMVRPRLFDSCCVLQLKREIAHGYIVLLGGPAVVDNKKENVDDDHIPLAFMALTEGNVIDACFGVKTTTKKDSPARRAAVAAKNALRDAVDVDDQIRLLAVQAYRAAMETVADYQQHRRRCNLLWRCLVARRLYKHAELQLEKSFENVRHALEILPEVDQQQ